MQVNILPPGTPRSMEADLFSKNNQVQHFVDQRRQALQQQMQTYYGQAGMDFLQSSHQFYQDYANSTGLQAADYIAETTKSVFNMHNDKIVPLESVEELQQASGRMVQYLMANPYMTDLYYQGRIDGYGEHFHDVQPQAVGFDRDDFRAVVDTQGQSSWDPDHTEEQEEVWHNLSHNLSDEGDGLSHNQQTSVIRAWRLQRHYGHDNIDSSSLDGFEIRPEE